MITSLLTFIVSLFIVICAWSAFEIYLEKRKKIPRTLQHISQSSDDHP